MDIQQLKLLKILVIGDSCIDKYHFGISERLSQEAPVPVFRLLNTEENLGMAGNLYQNLKNLCPRATLITNEATITKERYIEKNSKQHLLRVDVGEKQKLKPFRKENYKNIENGDYDCYCISDYCKGFIDDVAIKQILDLAKKDKKPVFVDSKKRDLSLFNECFIKINRHEYDLLTKVPKKSEIIITQGKEGSIWRRKSFNSVYSEVDDTTLAPNVVGAGDTFLAGFIIKHLLTKNIEASIVFANLCASIAVKNFGTYAITLEDISDNLRF
jgi:D-beta-D-heptose 7-phosphate kinase/D-beta-D-heptose 1-phosphate adenosyltransferase